MSSAANTFLIFFKEKLFLMTNEIVAHSIKT